MTATCLVGSVFLVGAIFVAKGWRVFLVVPLGNKGIKSNPSILFLDSFGFGLKRCCHPEWHISCSWVVPLPLDSFLFRRARTTPRNAFLGVDQVVCVLSVHRYGIAHSEIALATGEGGRVRYDRKMLSDYLFLWSN